jgi:hypothetical protein
MTAVIARILLRYVAGALIAAGYLDTTMGSSIANDPDLLILVGTVIGAVTEGAYYLAHKLGWSR